MFSEESCPFKDILAKWILNITCGKMCIFENYVAQSLCYLSKILKSLVHILVSPIKKKKKILIHQYTTFF